MKKPVLLCILDGWGVAPKSPNNAISEGAKFFHHLVKEHSYTTLNASENFVGLPCGQMGNSEVGHMTIGLGRRLLQDLVKIDSALADGAIQRHPAVLSMIDDLTKMKGVCHVMGLLSPGGVHSHQDHIEKIIDFLINTQNVSVCFHGILDGRDTAPKSAIAYVESLHDKFSNNPLFTWGTLSGRYFAMDRDRRYDRTEMAYDAITKAKGDKFDNPIDYIEKQYAQGITDEFVKPGVNTLYQGIHQEKDSLWMLNFRADRVRQILHALLLKTFEGFTRSDVPLFQDALGFHFYSPDLEMSGAIKPLLLKDEVSDSLGEVISNKGLKQYRIAETEKYAHITFFFNGGAEDPFEREERVMIDSPKVATYDLKPEMSALEILDRLEKVLNKKEHDLIVVNFANTDMVGHTGVKDAIVRAVQTVDYCVEALSKLCLKNSYAMIVTADHGNAESIFDEKTNQPLTAHTLNPVPFLLISDRQYKLKNGGTLADIAPTILEIMDIGKPSLMDGESLIC